MRRLRQTGHLQINRLAAAPHQPVAELGTGDAILCAFWGIPVGLQRRGVFRAIVMGHLDAKNRFR